MMNCKNCGAPLKEGARFCSKCGKPVAEKNVPAGTPVKPPVSQQPQKDEKQKKTGKGPLVVVLVILMLALMGTAGVIAYRVVNGVIGSGDAPDFNDDRDKKSEDEETEKETQEEETELDETEEDSKAAGEETKAQSETAAAVTTTEAQNETGIHRYELVAADCTWNEAYNLAKAAGGYLVHINDQEEYDYLLNYVLNTEEAREMKYWIGGARSAESYEYHWANIDGTFGNEVLNSVSYSSWWMQNEPSFRDDSIGQDEYYMNMFYYEKEDRWVWNDVPDDLIAAVSSYQGSIGYIIEFD